MVATRREWPDVVGSRDSIAITDASTKPSNNTRISSYKSAFSKAIPAIATHASARSSER